MRKLTKKERAELDNFCDQVVALLPQLQALLAAVNRLVELRTRRQ